MFNLEGRRFYRLRPGRKIFLQAFNYGYRICFLTNSNNIKAPFKFYDIPYNEEVSCEKTNEFIIKFGTYYFRKLNECIFKHSNQSQFDPFIIPRSQDRHANYDHMNPKDVKYLIRIEIVNYRFQIQNASFVPSKNWICPLMIKEAQKLNWNNAPRIMVMGPPASGKGRMLNTIMNWGQESGLPPLLLDIDVGQGCIGVPGMLGIAKIVNKFSVEQVPGSECTFAKGYPHLIHYGHTSPNKDLDAYYNALHSLVKLEKEAQLREQTETNKNHGILVNTHGWVVENSGFEMIVTLIKKLKIDLIYVHADYWLYRRLFSQMFQIDLNDFLKSKNDPDLSKKMKLADGFSQRLKPENLIYIPAILFEKRTKNSLR